MLRTEIILQNEPVKNPPTSSSLTVLFQEMQRDVNFFIVDYLLNYAKFKID